MRRFPRWRKNAPPPSLWPQILGKVVYAGDVAPGSIEAVDETKLYRIGADAEDDGNRAGRSLGRERRCRAARCGDDSHLALDKLGHQCRHTIELILSPTIFDYDVAAIDETGFAEALTKCRGEMGASIGGALMEKPDHRNRLLCACGEWPRDSCAAKQCNKLAPSDVACHLTLRLGVFMQWRDDTTLPPARCGRGAPPRN